MTAMQADMEQARHARSLSMQHLAAIRALAEETGRPPDEVAAVYQCQLVLLASNALVQDYLPVLVMKRVRCLYRQRLATPPAGPA